MKIRSMLLLGAAAFVGVSTPGQSATINLIDLGGVTGSQAEQGFKIAAAYWGNMFTNTAVINLGVRFAPLAPNIIGSTGSRRTDQTVASWANAWNATKSNSTLDQTAILPTLSAGGGISYIAQGVDGNGDQNELFKYYDAGTKTASKVLYLNSSVSKAIGLGLSSPGSLDGSVTFSSNFGFDFNPTDGITANTFDFIGVAIHEIGHALGFVSGVDLIDYYSYPNGPGRGALGYDFNDTSLFSALDMFRYSADPDGIAPGSGPAIDLTVDGLKYFSIDGGATALFGNSFSTGAYNGDGRQASHWKDTAGCQIGNGIMDPTFCFGQLGAITALDLAGFDAMGWNLKVDAVKNPNYLATSASIYATFVPEPGTWAMMIAGLGLVGASLRRRQTRTSVSFG